MTLEGTLCYSCGSLFNANAPKCDDFDRFNTSQRARCQPNEGCLMYTWQKSATKKGLYPGAASLLTHFVILHKKRFCSGVIRECFSTSFKLGQRSQPVQVTPFCQLQRTQSDASSSIRACICTEDFCNDEPADNNQIGKDPTGNNPNGALKTVVVKHRSTDCADYTDCTD